MKRLKKLSKTSGTENSLSTTGNKLFISHAFFLRKFEHHNQTLNTRELGGPPPLLSVLATALHLPLVGIWRARKALGRSLRFGNVLAFGGPPFGTAPTFRERFGIWRAALWDGPYVSGTFWHLAGRPLGRPLRFGNVSEFGGPPFGTAPTFRDFNGHLLGCPYTNYFTSMRWASATFFGSSFGRVTVRTPSLKAAWIPSFWMLRTVN